MVFGNFVGDRETGSGADDGVCRLAVTDIEDLVAGEIGIIGGTAVG